MKKKRSVTQWFLGLTIPRDAPSLGHKRSNLDLLRARSSDRASPTISRHFGQLALARRTAAGINAKEAWVINQPEDEALPEPPSAV